MAMLSTATTSHLIRLLLRMASVQWKKRERGRFVGHGRDWSKLLGMRVCRRYGGYCRLLCAPHLSTGLTIQSDGCACQCHLFRRVRLSTNESPLLYSNYPCAISCWDLSPNTRRCCHLPYRTLPHTVAGLPLNRKPVLLSHSFKWRILP